MADAHTPSQNFAGSQDAAIPVAARPPATKRFTVKEAERLTDADHLRCAVKEAIRIVRGGE